jgi:hypothetical protein
MPLIAERITVAANSLGFPMSGKQYEFMHASGEISIAIVAAATGVLATVYSGPDLLQQEGQVTIKAANSAPIYPDDYHLIDDVAAGDRLNIILRNTTGAGIDVFVYVKIDED